VKDTGVVGRTEGVAHRRRHTERLRRLEREREAVEGDPLHELHSDPQGLVIFCAKVVQRDDPGVL
jgi:hypothetical protein